MKTRVLTIIFALAATMAVGANAYNNETLYLSGHGPEDAVKWDFWCSDGMRSGKWSKIAVPSCWEQQGFGGYTYGRYYIYDRGENKKFAELREHAFTKEYGKYRHSFKVPREWQGRRVAIVFEGVMTDAEVKVNGQLAGEVHHGGFYRFSYDISDKLQYGKKNLLEVKVDKQSADKSVNNAERRADWWLFGGIYRPVYLEARPAKSIEHVAIDARADGTLRTDLRCVGLEGGEKVEFVLTGTATATGTVVGKQVKSLAESITTKWDGIKLWDTEHPNLYNLTVRLLSKDGKTLHEVKERIGFRTIEFRPHDGLYLNDTKLLVKGTNRHCFDPRTGRTVSRELNELDVCLIKQMNMNAVRSHYPPDTYFLDLCDSLGLLYLNELAGWQNSYSDKVGHKLVKEMVERDVNHPCIFLWSNGNEGGFNTSLDADFGKYDPQQRHVVHAWADFDELDCRHYPTTQDQVYRLDHGQRVFMMTEFLHGLYDRGQGAGLEGLWNKFRRSRLFAGGFIWAYVDEALWRTDTKTMDTYGPNAPDGIVSAERQPLGSFNTVRQVWSPIQIREFEAGRSFRGSFLIENGYMFSRLREAKMQWEVVSLPKSGERVMAEGTVTLPDIAPGETGHATFTLPQDYLQGDMLRLQAYNSKGENVCTWTFPIKRPKEYLDGKGLRTYEDEAGLTSLRSGLTAYEGEGKGGNNANVTEQDSLIVLSANGVTAKLSKNSGLLVSLQKGDSIVPITNGPLPVGIKATLREMNVRADGRVVAKYDGGIDTIVWCMTPDGKLGMDALVLNWRSDNKFEGEYLPSACRNLGLTFSYTEENVSGMRWFGRGPYRVWKNRIPGTHLGIWQKDYNNTVTGEYYYPQIYPEFKGYHADLYWATLQGKNAPSMTVSTETDGLFFRIFTAEEQRDREGRGHSVASWPEGDLSFLLEIPGVNSQGADGDAAIARIKKDDAGFHIKLWFEAE